MPTPGSETAGVGEESPRSIAETFAIDDPVDKVEPYGRGLINATFRVDAGGHGYVLQRINDRVFPDPPSIMANIQALDRHARTSECLDLRVPRLIPTREGASCRRDSRGRCWRLMTLIDDAVTPPQIETAAEAREVGALLGRFHRLLRSLPVERMRTVLPGFHDTPRHFRRCIEALEAADGAERGTEIADCARFVRAREALAGRLEAARVAGLIPLRVTHGDPKLDNLLFARGDGRGLALIDLDTLQPGLTLQDIGDCLRSCCNRRGESASGGAEIRFDLEIAQTILQAYAEHSRDWLTPAEIALLPDAIALMPFELGLRFLADHLAGDRYFKVSERGENLRKARVQFALVEDIERGIDDLRIRVAEAFATTGPVDPGPADSTASPRLPPA